MTGKTFIVDAKTSGYAAFKNLLLKEGLQQQKNVISPSDCKDLSTTKQQTQLTLTGRRRVKEPTPSSSISKKNKKPPAPPNLKYKTREQKTMQVTDLIHYNHTVRNAYLEAIEKLSWNEVTANKGLSWDSIRNVFVHLTLVEDRWINYAIPGKIEKWVDPDFDNFANTDSIREYMMRVHAATEKFLANLSQADLLREIEVPYGEKPYSKLPTETLLTHMVLEAMIHYGELTAAIWQMGIEPPYKAYWRFMHQTRQL